MPLLPIDNSTTVQTVRLVCAACDRVVDTYLTWRELHELGSELLDMVTTAVRAAVAGAAWDLTYGTDSWTYRWASYGCAYVAWLGRRGWDGHRPPTRPQWRHKT